MVHLARAGWLHYRDAFKSPAPLKPGKGPIALRVRLDDGSGFDLTEAGTQKKLAAYLVTDPAQVPGVARLGPDALAVDLRRVRRADPRSATRPDQGRAHRPGGARRGRQRVLRRDPARGARCRRSRCTDKLTDEQIATPVRGDPTGARPTRSTRSVGQKAAELKGEKRSGLRVHARTGLPCPVCGDTVREVSFADSSLQYCPTCQTGGKPLADRRLSKLIR